MEQNLNSISGLFDALFSLFSSLFLFLPDWSLSFIGSILMFAIGVFILKLIF